MINEDWKVEEIKDDKKIVAKISSDGEVLGIVTKKGEVLGNVGQVDVKSIRGALKYEKAYYALVGKVQSPVTPSARMQAHKMIKDKRVYDIDWEIKKVQKNKDDILALILSEKETVGLVLNSGIILGKLGVVKIPFRVSKKVTIKFKGLRYDYVGEVKPPLNDKKLEDALELVAKLHMQ